MAKSNATILEEHAVSITINEFLKYFLQLQQFI
jgi:hypothetical protein